ncbi:hypothetical protein [Kordia sp.]|uniref:hypothetical protein n=1 Tax=Kordia sp. TaxID=1965332 RepID=UPI0025C3AE06|nr:hypothetical protein [Kordia sp.]MCH2194385.1 hypothetical protein [Kordia sp.]
MTDNQEKFIQITSKDFWFKNNPEKIAGIEIQTTSLHFPIQVKGTKKDVLNVINATIKKQPDREKEAMAIALAMQMKIKILKLKSNA